MNEPWNRETAEKTRRADPEIEDADFLRVAEQRVRPEGNDREQKRTRDGFEQKQDGKGAGRGLAG
jgi:hypothetical protein